MFVAEHGQLIVHRELLRDRERGSESDGPAYSEAQNSLEVPRWRPPS